MKRNLKIYLGRRLTSHWTLTDYSVNLHQSPLCLDNLNQFKINLNNHRGRRQAAHLTLTSYSVNLYQSPLCLDNLNQFKINLYNHRGRRQAAHWTRTGYSADNQNLRNSLNWVDRRFKENKMANKSIRFIPILSTIRHNLCLITRHTSSNHNSRSLKGLFLVSNP